MSDINLVVTLGRNKRTISPDPNGTHVLMTMERFADIMDELDEAADEIGRLRGDLEWMIKLHGWTPQPEEGSNE